MPKLVWTNGFELDWKVFSAIVWAIWMTAITYYRVNTIEEQQLKYQAQANVQFSDLTVAKERLNVMEQRVDVCCPWFHGQYQGGSR